MRSDLASGAWIEHLPVQDLKAKHIDIMSTVVRVTAPVSAEGGIDMAAAAARQRARAETALRDARWAVLVTGWSYDLPVPQWDGDALEVRDAESVGEIPAGDYGDIEDILAPHTLVLLRRPDPKGTTTSSSNGLSRARVTSRKG